MQKRGKAGASHARWIGFLTLALLWPYFLIAWAGGKYLMRLRGWKDRVLAISLLINAASVALGLVIFLCYLEEEATLPALEYAGKLPGHFVPIEQGPLYWAIPAPGTQLAEVEGVVGPSIYAVFQGRVCASFKFTDVKMAALTEVWLWDWNREQTWICANLKDGTFTYDRYAAADSTEPAESLTDKDGDGVPDLLVDWAAHQSFVLAEPVKWRPLSVDQEMARREATPPILTTTKSATGP